MGGVMEKSEESILAWRKSMEVIESQQLLNRSVFLFILCKVTRDKLPSLIYASASPMEHSQAAHLTKPHCDDNRKMAFNLTKRLENLEESGLRIVKDELVEMTEELQHEMDSLLEDNRVRQRHAVAQLTIHPPCHACIIYILILIGTSISITQQSETRTATRMRSTCPC